MVSQQQRPLNSYVYKILAYYISLPNTPTRPRKDDRFVAQKLYNRNIPFMTMECAFLLGTARRCFRDEENGPPLDPIRSLRYFLPVVDELQVIGVDNTYVEYLRNKLEPLLQKQPELLERKRRVRRDSRSANKTKQVQLSFKW